MVWASLEFYVFPFISVLLKRPVLTTGAVVAKSTALVYITIVRQECRQVAEGKVSDVTADTSRGKQQIWEGCSVYFGALLAKWKSLLPLLAHVLF